MFNYYFMYFFDMMEVVENGVWVSDMRRAARDFDVWRRVIFLFIIMKNENYWKKIFLLIVKIKLSINIKDK